MRKIIIICFSLIFSATPFILSCGEKGDGGGGLPATYRVTYNANGADSGDIPVDNTEYANGETVTVLGNTGNLIRSGYLLTGWNTEADGSGTSYITGETFAISSANVNLYAIWTMKWTRLSGVSGADTEGSGISVDSEGNIYVTGTTNGSLDGETLKGTQDVFVMKYNSSGTKQWTRLSGVSGVYTSAYGISADSSGNTYVTGYTNGDLDGETLTGAIDAFVIKYDSSGTKQWTRLSGVSGVYTSAYGISADSSGNTYVTGLTEGALDGLALTGLADIFVIKYNSSGTKQWTRLSGASGAFLNGEGISLDSSGNIYVSGYTNRALDGQALTGTHDVFVIKYNIYGAKQWTRLSGAAGADTFTKGISADSSGNTYVTGFTEGNLDGQILTGTRDIFVIKYNSSGTKQWTMLSGIAGVVSQGIGISVDLIGNTYVNGFTEGNLEGQTLNGTSDAFVTTKFNN